MARINRAELTRLEIIRVAMAKFMENGYTNTPIKAISNELNMSPGNLTFHFPTKEHLLVTLIEMLCKFQWNLMQRELEEGDSPVVAICREMMFLVLMCEVDEAIRDLFLASYTSPMCLEFVRKNDEERSKEVYREYCPGWSDEQFREAEILVSGIEYATLMTTGDPLPMETRVAGAIDQILSIYQVPKEIRRQKIGRVLAMDYHQVGKRVLHAFHDFVEETSKQALVDLLK